RGGGDADRQLMARPARPLWLVRPSRITGLSANQAVAVALFLLLIVAGALAGARGGMAPGTRAAIEHSDVSVHDGVVGALRGGEPY
ncbi:UNVERIFIED_CONTAM: hypothetical protein NY603_32115, partial [Bacteroidetes bacterium 56_B9]